MKRLTILILTILMLLSICPCASAMEIPDGAYGVIWIPCLKIKMPVYTPEVNTVAIRQEIIDAEESAVIFNWGTAYQIGDHVFSKGLNGEGEWNLQKVFAGAYAWFYTIDGTYYLECYMTGKADYDGNEYLNGRLVTPCSSHDLLLHCCAEDSSHHLIAVFRRLREMS